MIRMTVCTPPGWRKSRRLSPGGPVLFQVILVDSEETVGQAPADRPIACQEPQSASAAGPSNPFQEQLLRAADQHRRASQAHKRWIIRGGDFLVEPAGPLRHDWQSKPLRDAVQHERRIVITQDGSPASGSAPGRVLASSAETATRWRIGLRPAIVIVPRKHWASSPRLAVSGLMPGASTVKWFCSITAAQMAPTSESPPRTDMR
jgi:hypothetical protein